jgi:hypothetical protein
MEFRYIFCRCGVLQFHMLRTHADCGMLGNNLAELLKLRMRSEQGQI